jgi:hypothetical protein
MQGPGTDTKRTGVGSSPTARLCCSEFSKRRARSRSGYTRVEFSNQIESFGKGCPPLLRANFSSAAATRGAAVVLAPQLQFTREV